jgi:predicted nucleic acid-binding Zn ribbon protein
MALFSNPEDMRLPALTVITQVQRKDVFDFLTRGFYQSCDRSNTICGAVVVFGGMSPGQMQAVLVKHARLRRRDRQMQAGKEKRDQLRRHRDRQIQKTNEKYTVTILEVRDLADKILRQRAEIGKTHVGLITEFNALYLKHSEHSHTTFVGDGIDANWFAKRAVLVKTANNSLSNVLMIVLDDLFKIMRDDLPVKSCPECGSPFPVNRAKALHQFCSERCSSRARNRRHRERSASSALKLTLEA